MKKFRRRSKPIFWPRSQKKASRPEKSPRSPAHCATNQSSRRLTQKPVRVKSSMSSAPAATGARHDQHFHDRRHHLRRSRRDRRQARQPRRHFAGRKRGRPGSSRIKIDLPPEEAARSCATATSRFFRAKLSSRVQKHFARAKICAERGQRTIFNLLGPLLNPARPSAMLMGVPKPELCEPLARVLPSLGVRRAMVVCGKVSGVGFLDELSTLGENSSRNFFRRLQFCDRRANLRRVARCQ